MCLHPISVNKNVHKYISPKLCFTPDIKSKYFRIGECVGIGQTTVFLSLFQPIKSRYTTPLEAVAPEPKPYISPSMVKSAESPFYMANDNDMKRFMSGR